MKDAQGREVQAVYTGNGWAIYRQQYAGAHYSDQLGTANSQALADERVRRVVAGEPIISDRELFEMGMVHRNDGTPFLRDASGARQFSR